MVVVRLSAAISGAAITFAHCSVAMAHTEIPVVHAAAAVVGAASMYNPYGPGYREGGIETASGERYNASAWAAAIQTALREKFGGVPQGNKASYALVEGSN